jgi:hypothetical protein
MGVPDGPTDERIHPSNQQADDESNEAVGRRQAAPLATVPLGVTMTHVLEETVLLNAESGVYYGLNDTGRLMLDLCLASDDSDAVVRQLASELEADPAELEADLYGLLSRLEQEGLVEVSPAIGAEVARAAERLPPPE